jgi:hypothetical protein
MGRSIRIRNTLALLLSHQPGPLGDGFLDAGAELLNSGWCEFELMAVDSTMGA